MEIINRLKAGDNLDAGYDHLKTILVTDYSEVSFKRYI